WCAAATLPIATLGALVHPAFALIAPLVLAPLAMLISARRIATILVSLAISVVIAAPFLVREIQTRLVDIANYRYYASLNTFVDLDSGRYLLALASNLGSPRTPGALPLEHAFPSGLSNGTPRQSSNVRDS